MRWPGRTRTRNTSQAAAGLSSGSPRVRSALRDKEAPTPRPSTTCAGTATVHRTRRMTPGTTNSTKPIISPSEMTKLSSSTGTASRDTAASACPVVVRRPFRCSITMIVSAVCSSTVRNIVTKMPGPPASTLATGLVSSRSVARRSTSDKPTATTFTAKLSITMLAAFAEMASTTCRMTRPASSFGVAKLSDMGPRRRRLRLPSLRRQHAWVNTVLVNS